MTPASGEIRKETSVEAVMLYMICVRLASNSSCSGNTRKLKE